MAATAPLIPSILRAGSADAVAALFARRAREYDWWAHFAAALRIGALQASGGCVGGGAPALAAPHVLAVERFAPPYLDSLRPRELGALAFLSASAQRVLSPRLHAAVHARLTAASAAPGMGGMWHWPSLSEPASGPRLAAAHYEVLWLPRSAGELPQLQSPHVRQVTASANLSWALARQQLFVPAAFAGLASEVAPALTCSGGAGDARTEVLLQLLWALGRGGGRAGDAVASTIDALAAALSVRTLAYPQQVLLVWCLATADCTGAGAISALRALTPAVFAPSSLARLRVSPLPGAQQQLFQAHALLAPRASALGLQPLPASLPAWLWEAAPAKATAPAEDATPGASAGGALAGLADALRALRVRHVVGYALDGYRLAFALPAARIAIEPAASADAAKARYLSARGWLLVEVDDARWRSLPPYQRLALADELTHNRGERERALAGQTAASKASVAAAL